MSKQIHIVIWMIVLLMMSCRKDPLPAGPDSGQVELKFKLAMPFPVPAGIKTYAISDTDENVIRQIILLVFKVSGTDETLEYYKEGMQVYSTAVPNEKSFYTKLLKGTDTYRFVLLINGGDGLSDIVESIPAGTEKSVIMDQLTANVTAKWNAASSANFDPLPMWAESEEVAGINAQTVLPPMKLIRSLVRVDIKLDADALTNFQITSVNIYDANDKIRMAPLPIHYDEVNGVVNAPSLPAGTSPVLDLVYDGFGQVTSLEREIYLAEADAGTTRIVVGGIFDTDLTPTYYEATLTPALLRNNKYIIKITKVNGPGELSPGDALSLQNPHENIRNRSRIFTTHANNRGALSYTVSVIQDDLITRDLKAKKAK